MRGNCGDSGALGLLAHFDFDRCRLQRLKFSFDSGNISIDQVVEQADLIRAQLLAALGELEALEQRDLAGQLLVDLLVMSDLLLHRLDALDQLRRQDMQFFRGLIDRDSDAKSCRRFCQRGLVATID